MSTSDTPATTVEDAIARVDAVLAELRAIAPPPTPGTFAAIGDVVSGELIESAWGNNVGNHIDELDRIISAEPSGTAGQDFVRLDSLPNQAIHILDKSRRWEYISAVSAGNGVTIGDTLDGRNGIMFGSNGAPYFPPALLSRLTGTGDPKYFYDVCSTSPSDRVRVRFLNVTDIEASVPWPVASSIELKSAVVDAGEVPDLRELRVVRFVRADDPAATERIGFIAEELGAAMPEAAVSSDDGTSRSYLNEVVTAVLVATVQSLLDRVEALESAAGA